jgi:thiamine pyrophosphate-dependent acetolactate synthase large subunit-like protein
VRTLARIGGAAAHNRPRRIEARPSASAEVRAAGPGAAHTVANVVTAAVFHAPMLAFKADAEENACAPTPHAVDADGQGLARVRVSG